MWMKRISLAIVTGVFLLLGAAAPVRASAESAAIQAFLSHPPSFLNGLHLRPAELDRFYAMRQYKPVWDISSKAKRETLKTFLSSVMAFARYNGLALRDYPSEEIERMIESGQEEDNVRLEVQMTDWILDVARDLRGGRVNLKHLYPGWTFEPEERDLVAELAQAAASNHIGEWLNSLPPPGPVYAALARELKTYREFEKAGLWPRVSSGPTLKPGTRDARVLEVRKRLAAEGYSLRTDISQNEAEVYDDAMKEVVENYQRRNGLEADGNIGEKTLKAMNVSLRDRINQIAANMERWRYMPSAFPSRYAMVNIADARLVIMDGDRSLYNGPVVVGRPDRKTPFIHSLIRSIIFNPSWHVPAKIARKDILPKLRKDPHYLEKLGFVISSGDDDDPHGETIDWHKIKESEFNFRLRQSPGDMNSLGRLKFDFDNNFAVYMHGTPHQELFDKAERNRSSGCVRLRDPDEVASIVLAPNEGDWNLERVREEVDKRKTRWLSVERPLPLYFVYWSVFPSDDDGPPNFRMDVYNYDRFLNENLRFKSKGDTEASLPEPFETVQIQIPERTD